MTRRLIGLALGVGAAMACVALRTEASTVVILDDGEKIAEDLRRPLPPSVWGGPIDLFALRGETLAFQVVLDATNADISNGEARLDPFSALPPSPLPALLAARVHVLAERFVPILRPTGNDRDPEASLAFTRKSAPPASSFVGSFADALVSGAANVPRGRRGALWVDIDVPIDAPAGAYGSVLHVTDANGELARRDVRVRVLDATLPYAAAPATVYYDSATLRARMGDAALPAERSLRRLLHAHHLSVIHEASDAAHASVDRVALDKAALDGSLFTAASGYDGPGDGVGEGIFAIGAYGSLGAPTRDSLERAQVLARSVRTGAERTFAFLYAADEKCTSPLPEQWRRALQADPEVERLAVGASCGDDPLAQSADVVMQTSEDYVPMRARAAREAGKDVWVYNGRRPFAGPMMLDVPATDLRANGWIAARYRVSRWFYWESAYWLDDGRGGKGRGRGYDPFAVAESFHNADEDHANGDGILTYPGTQPSAPGMHDEGAAVVFASIRLKNLRRGIEDAGYIALARAVDEARTDAVVRRIIPRALAGPDGRVPWPERGAVWLSAREELAKIIESRDAPTAAVGPDAGPFVAPVGCSVGMRAQRGRDPSWVVWVLVAVFLLYSSSFRSFARTLKSSSVDVSLFPSVAPDAISFKRRRMIFPLRVFGRASAKRT